MEGDSVSLLSEAGRGGGGGRGGDSQSDYMIWPTVSSVGCTVGGVLQINTHITTEHHQSDSEAVQCLLQIAAHQRSDVCCASLGSGPQCGKQRRGDIYCYRDKSGKEKVKCVTQGKCYATKGEIIKLPGGDDCISGQMRQGNRDMFQQGRRGWGGDGGGGWGIRQLPSHREPA